MHLILGFSGATVWLATWSDHNQKVLSSEDSDSSSFDNGFYLGVLAAFGAAQALVSFFRNWFFFITCAKGSVTLHEDMFDVIMNARQGAF